MFDDVTQVRSSQGLRSISDRMWALLFGSASVLVYLIAISVSTDFLVATGGPSIPVERVWATVAVFALQAVPLIWRTSHPLLSFWLVYAGFLAAVALTIDRNFTVSPSLLFAIFSVTALTSARTWVPTLSIAIVVDLAVHLGIAFFFDGGPSVLATFVVAVRVLPSYAAPLLAGLLSSAQSRQTLLATKHAEVLRVAADAQLTAAVASERNRMARELHDLAAHHLSGIILQTKAAIRVQTSDPETTAVLLDSIRSEGELTLENLREVLIMLREDDADGQSSGVAAPTLSRLPDLLDSVRTLYPSLDLQVDGDIDDLSPATSLACYRIIQESLTNVRKHAPGADVGIRIHRDARELVLAVSNGPSPEPVSAVPVAPGYGLLGMRERAVMLGGSISAEPTVGGGWQTIAVIPVDRRVAA